MPNIRIVTVPLITYKGIDPEERFGDAPFVGALLIAKGCSGNCKGCFNQHLKEEKDIQANVEDILDEVQQNSLYQGIILGGLEWTEQPDDMIEIIQSALQRPSLQIMVYTRLTEEVFFATFPNLRDCGPIWYKFGPYVESLRSYDHIEHGVILATTNQHVKFYPGRK